jgi:hypothetical protein
VMAGTTVSGRNGGVAYGGGAGGGVAAADSRAGKADRPAAGCKPGSGGVLRARSGHAEEVDRKSGRGRKRGGLLVWSPLCCADAHFRGGDPGGRRRTSRVRKRRLLAPTAATIIRTRHAVRILAREASSVFAS